MDEVYGSIEHVPNETIEQYFDYEKFGRDASMELYEDEDQEYYDQFSSDQEYGEALVDDFGGVANLLGERAKHYFDYEKFGRDLAFDYTLCGTNYVRVD